MTLTQKSFSFFLSDVDHRPTVLVQSTCPYPGACVRPRIDTRLKAKASLTAKATARVAKQGIWDGMKIAQTSRAEVKFSRSSRWSACPTGAPVLVLHGYD
jgi:hypothetical protein